MGELAAEIDLLGPLEVRVGGRVVPLSRPRQRSLLAVLALDAGVCVSRGRLVDALWGERPPESVNHALQVHVSSLRKALGPELVETCPGGYRLALRREAVDALRAEDLVAGGALDDAIALFRGEPLSDVELEGAAAKEAARLADLRVEALERRFELRLGAGEGAALVPGLERLVAESPLRERPRAQLMLALYRAGRQADALAVYQETRRMLVDELGIEPSRALRDIEAAILRHDDELSPPPVAGAAGGRADTATARRVPALVVAAAVVVVAGSAGVAAAFLMPPGHPRAAVGRTSAATRAVSTLVTAPTHAAKHRRPARHLTARPVRKTNVPAVVVVAPVGRTTTARAAGTAVAPTTTGLSPATTTTRKPVPQVTTYPTRTTTQPRITTTAPTKGPVHIVDTFDAGVVDDSVWNVLFNGTGEDAVQRDGKLVLSIAEGAQPGGAWNMVSVEYGSRECFSGDIDEQVDYRLVNWSSGTDAYVALKAVFANGFVERMAPLSGGDIIGSGIGPRFTSAVADGSTGSLRLTRIGGVMTTYYLVDGAWQQVDTGPAPSPAHLHIGLGLNPGRSATTGIVVELDNFSATAYGPTSC